YEGANKIAWTVKVREGSNLIGLAPDALAAIDQVSEVYEKFNTSTRHLMNGSVEEAGLSDAALGHFRQLSQLTAGKNESITMKFWVQRRPTEFGPKVAEVIRENERADYKDIGSIEGRLQAIQDMGGALRIKIKDPLYPRAIECKLPEDMIESALATFRKRVEITGMIHYRRNGIPMSIEVSNIDVLPDDSELPSIEDVRGILAAS
ncbi:MAG: hypothetical protein VR75_17610, partial [Hyphomonadaceae bacterium BRH_c29]